MSAHAGARESLVLKPEDFEVFGLPLSLSFFALLAALLLRVLFSRGHRLHPIWPLLLAAGGTAMMVTLVGFAIHDDVAKFFTSAFYLGLSAFLLNTVFDGFEVLDRRKLRVQSDAAN